MRNNKNEQDAIKMQMNDTYFLSDIINIAVYSNGKKLGKLSDFIIHDENKIAKVTHIIIRRPFGEPELSIPWENIVNFPKKRLDIDIKNLENYIFNANENHLLLKDHILDKKVIDIEYSEVEVVYDIKMVLKNKNLYITEVDISKYQLLRRLGLAFLAKFLFANGKKKSLAIPWSYIQPLPDTIGSFKGDIQLKCLKEILSEMAPVDLADILEELDSPQRAIIFEGLELEQASDTLEEIEPKVQREIVFSLKNDKIAPLIDDMTPGQAADILSVLPSSDAKNLLDLLTNKENAEKIRSIMEKQDEKILDFAVSESEFIKLQPKMTVKKAREEYQDLASGKAVIMYLYIVDENDNLKGVIDIKELLQSNNENLLEDIMTTHVISLKPENTLKDASIMFSRYAFRALPITDDNDKLLGIIPYRDVMNLRHLFF